MRYQCALLCFATLLTGCSSGSGAEPSAGLPVAEGCFVTDTGTVSVSLELATRQPERSKGLMGRESLAASSGMLFKYQQQQTAEHGFWMYQTLIPLDIAYLDENGAIGNILQMEPCASSNGMRCPSYPAGVKFTSAVEMNAGFFEANKIGPGDHLKLGKENCKAP